MNRPRVSVVIPAYNEEATVGHVASVAASSPLVDETIVVSDGSTDRTFERARAAGATVHETAGRQGKGGAMSLGVAKAAGSVLLFLDADLRGFTREHVDALLRPVLDESRAMTVGLRDRGPLLNRLLPHLPLIGGERAMRREVFEGIDPRFLFGFGAESALNYHCRLRGWPYGGVPLPGLHIRRKYEKVGFPRAVVEYTAMAGVVLRTMLHVRLARLQRRFPNSR